MRRNVFVAAVSAAALLGGSESAVSQAIPKRAAAAAGGGGGGGGGRKKLNEGAAAATADLDSFASFVSRKGLTSAVVPSTGEGVLAWVEYLRGTPNVFVARESDGFTAKPVTSYAGDAGFDISDLSLVVDSDDGSRIEALYSMFPSTKTEPQNPAHTLTPPTSSIFRVQVSSTSAKTRSDNERPAPPRTGAAKQEKELATPELLAADASISLSTYDGHSTGAIFTRYDPAFSSGGTTVLKTTTASSFARGTGQVNAGETPLFRVRQGQIGSMALRPGHGDGTTFAFENDRGDHGFIGVYNEGSASLLWVDPSFDSDEQPAWSPDGSKLGFLRFLQPLADAKGQSPANTQEGGRPFVVMVAEISNSSTAGAADNSGDLEVISATMVYDGCTSGYLDPAMYGVHPLQWSDNEHLLVPCENSGSVQCMRLVGMLNVMPRSLLVPMNLLCVLQLRLTLSL